MNLHGKRFVVIGGGGFIGSHVVDQLLTRDAGEVVVFGSLRNTAANLAHASKDDRLTCIEGSVADSSALQRALDSADGVFLMASVWLRECIANPRVGLEVNVIGGFNVLEACRETGVKRVVYASSSAVYGSETTPPITESHALRGTTFYGATKIAVEQFLQAFHQMHHLSYAICRYTNVYGPRQRAKGDATSVVIRFLDRIAANEPPVILGSGRQRYDFIYVEDAASASVLAMEADFEAEALNIASGQSVSINELVSTMLDLTGSTLRPVYQPGSEGEDMIVSTDKAAQLLGFRARTSLRDGLQALLTARIDEIERGFT